MQNCFRGNYANINLKNLSKHDKSTNGPCVIHNKKQKTYKKERLIRFSSPRQAVHQLAHNQIIICHIRLDTYIKAQIRSK